MTNSISNGLEAASKANEINPMYRFNLFCPDCDDVERLFYKGISYFVKIPFSSESVIRAVEFLKRFYNEQMHKSLLLKSKHGIESIIFSDIKYVMSDKRKVIIYKQTEESAYYYKLDEIEAMLGAGFLRCHQSFIVNMEMIKAFVPEGLILTDETFIPVSRKKYYAAKREYLEYITDNQII
ncbi:MAG: LytTR family transcriptional regulator DNA-binding domain-containing protein [Oscillospiraceae bacterium]|nr:LytTR family transcriptional regulator DNA-binding domain-containing protein [Oscillospiraceae bacterium]